MFAHTNFSRFRISRIVIYSLLATTFFLVIAAGSNAAVFSYLAPSVENSVSSALVDSSTSPQPEAPCVAPPGGIISWWSANNNAGDNKNLNNGVLVGNAGYITGNVGTAFNLDGDGDYVQVAAPVGLPVGASPRTVELWFKAPATPGESGLFQYGTASGGQMFGLITSGNAPGRLYFYGHSADLAANTVIQPGIWYHGAVTYDGVVVKLYVNGQLENSANLGLNTLLDANGITIGHRAGGSFWNGQIDEPTIYDRALSDAEILAIYNAGSSGKCLNCTPPPSGMIGWWPGDENSNDVIGGNNGSLFGGAGYASGKVGPAFSLNGMNQYVEIPDSPTLRPTDGLTLDGWFNFNTSNPNSSLISKPYLTGSANAYVLFVQGGLLYGGVGGGANVGQLFSPMPGRWYHLAYTYDSATAKHRLFIDGSVVATADYAAQFSYDTASVLIGVDKDNGTAVIPLDGLADESEIYGRALDPAEILTIYNAGSLGKCKYSCTPPPANMVSWWPGDGNGNDIQGPIFENATLVGTATYAAGKVGQAFSFDGTQGGYVEIPDSPALDPGDAFSVDGWFYIDPAAPRNFNDIGTLVGKSTGELNSNWSIYFDDRDGTKRLRYVMGANVSYANAIPTANWYHVAGTFDATSIPRAKLYLNGSLVADSGSEAFNVTPNNLPLRIGAMHWTETFNVGNDRLNGKADEVEFIHRAISPTEVQAIYNAGSAGKCKAQCTPAPANLVSWYRGESNADDAVSGYNGTLQNGTTFASGEVGQAFSFDGVDDIITIPHNPAQNTGAQITINAWVKRASARIGASIFQKRSPTNVGGYVFEVTGQDQDALQFVVMIGGVYYFATTPTGALSTGVWQHVAATYDGAAMKIYVDGVEKASVQQTGTIDPTTDDVVIGRNMVNTPFAWHGEIDEIQLLNRALSPSEIHAIFAAGNNGTCFPVATPTPTATQTVTPSATPTATPPLTLPNWDFELDPSGTVPPLTGWNGSFYSFNDCGVPGVPYGAHQINVTNARSYSGTRSIYSFVQNAGGANGCGDPNSRHTTSELISTVPFPTAANNLYIWRSDVNFTTTSRWYWRLEITLSDGVMTQDELLLCRDWGNNEGCPGNSVDTHDLSGTGTDGQTWYRHPIPIPPGMNTNNMKVTIRHQQDSWDGTTAQSEMYYDLVSEGIIPTPTPTNTPTATPTATPTGTPTPSPLRSRADFDADGRTDCSVFRPGDGTWYVDQTRDGYRVEQFGLAGDIPAPGDFDNDGKTDMAIFRADDTGVNPDFYVLYSATYTVQYTVWGSTGDLPVVADYDGDGRADYGIYRPSDSRWYILKTTGGFLNFPFGIPGDKAFPMDYDGDGKADPSVFRPSTATWFIAKNAGTPEQNFDAVVFGLGTDLPVPADYDGDGKDDIAMFRPSNGLWWLRRSTAGLTAIQFGLNGDIPSPGDYDGDGKDDLAIYRGGVWFMLYSSNDLAYVWNFGLSADVPIPSKYIP